MILLVITFYYLNFINFHFFSEMLICIIILFDILHIANPFIFFLLYYLICKCSLVKLASRIFFSSPHQPIRIGLAFIKLILFYFPDLELFFFVTLLILRRLTFHNSDFRFSLIPMLFLILVF